MGTVISGAVQYALYSTEERELDWQIWFER